MADENENTEDFLAGITDTSDASSVDTSDPFSTFEDSVTSSSSSDPFSSLDQSVNADPFAESDSPLSADPFAEPEAPVITDPVAEEEVAQTLSKGKKGKKERIKGGKKAVVPKATKGAKKEKAPKAKKEKAPKERKPRTPKEKAPHVSSPAPFVFLLIVLAVALVAANVVAFMTAGAGCATFLIVLDALGIVMLLVPVMLMSQLRRQPVGLFDMFLALAAIFSVISTIAFVSYQAKTYGASSKVSAVPSVTRVIDAPETFVC